MAACFGVDTLDHIKENFATKDILHLPPVIAPPLKNPLLKLEALFSTMMLPGMIHKHGNRQDSAYFKKDPATGRYFGASKQVESASAVSAKEQVAQMSALQVCEHYKILMYNTYFTFYFTIIHDLFHPPQEHLLSELAQAVAGIKQKAVPHERREVRHGSGLGARRHGRSVGFCTQ